MTIKARHTAYVSINGDNITFDNIPRWKQELLNHKGKRVFVTIDNIKKRRSDNQNAYAHGVVFPMIAEEMGCLMEEAKDALKWQFLRKQLDNGFWTVAPTSQLGTVEMEDFLSKCRMLASEMFNCYIPLPNEVEY